MKPCPHCGKQPVWWYSIEYDYFIIRCCSTIASESIMKVTRDWNTRAPYEIICTQCGLRESKGLAPKSDF